VRGLPIDIKAMPQCAMPHAGSSWRTLEKDFFAGSNQKEWNRAIARLNSFCALSLHETGKFTSPSFSGPPVCSSLSSCAQAPDEPTIRTIASIPVIPNVFFMIAPFGMLLNSFMNHGERLSIPLFFIILSGLLDSKCLMSKLFCHTGPVAADVFAYCHLVS
jgi:hypothetical protein